MLGLHVSARALLLACCLVLVAAPALAAQPATGQATLTVTAESVTVVHGPSGEAHQGASGETLSAGDRVITGTPGGAILTLSDGSEQELDAASEVELRALGQSSGGGTLAVIAQTVGITTNRVAALGPNSSYQLQTPSATALVRGTVFRTRLVTDPTTKQATEEDVSVEQGEVEVRVRTQVVTLTPGQRVRGVHTGTGGQTVQTAPNVTVEQGTIQTSTESGQPGGALASTTATPTILVGTTTPVFQADWSGGLNGWTGGSDWKVEGGELVSDPTPGWTQMLAPFQPSSDDYAVEAEMQLANPQGEDVGLVVRRQEDASTNCVSDGTGWNCNFYQGGVDLYASVATIGSTKTGYLAQQAFKPGSDWHRYRLEVQGNALRLLIDGNLMLSATDDSYPTGRGVGIYRGFYSQVRVRSFQVFNL